jgi:hypothetical protein
MKIQSRIPPALCAMHNFICRYDPFDDVDLDDNEDINGYGYGGDDLAVGPPTSDARTRASERRDLIAQQMWDDYTSLAR